MNKMKRWLVAGVSGFIPGIAVLCQITWAQAQPVIFSATEDVTYGTSQVPFFQQQLANHNRYSPSPFFVHLGDIFDGGEPCDDSHYSFMASMLKGLAVPVCIMPGDNETINCIGPTSALGLWKRYF